ncbi:MAG: DUF4960 domain-containing protein [Bacteroidota bacterium]|nr:DUF4960 domain-containing protein [Bacteroidota bacterium]
MKKNLKIYLLFLLLPFFTAACLEKEVFTVTPNLPAVSNLQYTLSGDSVILTWNLPQGHDSLSVSVSPNPSGIPLKMNATSCKMGIVEVNKPYMYTVKISDTKGNTSLGQSVSFTRSGASPLKNATVVQVDNNVLFTWSLPDSAITGIVLKYTDQSNVVQTVNIPATSTSYQISNPAVGNYHFGLYTTNSRNQVSQNIYLDLKVGATLLGYLGSAPDSLSLVTTADDDIIAGAKWFFQTYPKARYISLNNVKNGTVDLSKYRVIWWNYDIDDGTSDLPAIATDGAVVAKMTAYHKNGGNLLLSTYAIQYLWNLGRMPSNIHLSFDRGPGGLNPDVWGIGVNIGKKHNQSGHPLYKGISMTTQGDGRVTFPVIGNGWKENHNCIIIVPSIYNLANDNELVYTNFTTQNNAVWLGMWDGIGDYFMTGIFELTPKDNFQGRSISIGIGGIEWKVNSGDNPYQSTINLLYKNAIDYLKAN